MEDIKTISYLKILFLKADKREYSFNIKSSKDDETWVVLFTGKNRRQKDLEKFDFEDIKARYIKITGFGNEPFDGNARNKFPYWFNIVETEIYETTSIN